MVHHALPPEEWSVVYGFLGLFGEGGGRGVRSVCLWLEDPEEVSASVGGIFSFHLGRLRTGAGGVVVMISRSPRQTIM